MQVRLEIQYELVILGYNSKIFWIFLLRFGSKPNLIIFMILLIKAKVKRLSSWKLWKQSFKLKIIPPIMGKIRESLQILKVVIKKKSYYINRKMMGGRAIWKLYNPFLVFINLNKSGSDKAMRKRDFVFENPSFFLLLIGSVNHNRYTNC